MQLKRQSNRMKGEEAMAEQQRKLLQEVTRTHQNQTIYKYTQ